MPGNITIRCDRDGCFGHIIDERTLYFLVEDLIYCCGSCYTKAYPDATDRPPHKKISYNEVIELYKSKKLKQALEQGSEN